MKTVNLLSILMIMAVAATSCKEDITVVGIDLDNAEATVQVGATFDLNIIFTPSDATNKGIMWETSDAMVATINNGTVTGVTIGNATITATSKENPAITATCEIIVVPSNGQQITVSGDITSNTTWYANARYFLSGYVYVKNNATLTIEPGTIIKGVSGSKGTLIIERGSRIMAAGTSTSPIVFTSDKPAGQRAAGDWGGVVICGKATTNKHDEGAGVGIAEGGIGSYYGGTDDADNSGVLQYVRIEFPGIPLTATSNSEINGLTLYAVGSATTIDHIQVSYSGDDSFEWFGGTVNCKYLIAFRGLDDEFDTDNGYRGKVQFALGIRDPQIADQSGSNGFESDNDADGSILTPVTAPVFSNVTLFGPMAVNTTYNSLFKRAMHIRRSSQLSVYNSIVVGWPIGLILDGGSGNTPTMAENNTLQMEKVILAGMTANYAEASGTPATPYSVTQIQAYFEAISRGNSVSQSVSDITGGSLLSLTSPSLIPQAGSSFLTGASFTPAKLSGGFFSNVSHLGAFGTTDWTSGWANFDPQNTQY